MELTQRMVGVGIGDLQHAALAEARELMREAKGDRSVATALVYDRLHDLGWLSPGERDALQKMHAIGARSGFQTSAQDAGRPVATEAFLQVRGVYDELLRRGDTGPVALALAAGTVGSYEVVPGEDGTTVVYAKSNRSYQGILGGAGAIIGGAIGGSQGAAIGGAIGGVIGTIVDDCKD